MSMCVCMCVCIAGTYFVCSKGRVETYILVYVRTRHRHCPSHYFINDLPQNLNIHIFSSIVVCNFVPLIANVYCTDHGEAHSQRDLVGLDSWFDSATVGEWLPGWFRLRQGIVIDMHAWKCSSVESSCYLNRTWAEKKPTCFEECSTQKNRWPRIQDKQTQKMLKETN